MWGLVMLVRRTEEACQPTNIVNFLTPYCKLCLHTLGKKSQPPQRVGLGRAARGGALAPQLPHATHHQQEFIRIKIVENTIFPNFSLLSLPSRLAGPDVLWFKPICTRIRRFGRVLRVPLRQLRQFATN